MTALVVETGAGLANSNSYATTDEADEYHSKHLRPEPWQNQAETSRATALMMATRLLDENVRWQGTKEARDNALEWPRVSVVDRNGYSVDSNVVPQWLKDATAEMARNLITEDRTVEDGLSGFERLKVGPIELVPDKADRTGIIPKSVKGMVRDFGTVSGGMTRKLIRT